MIYSTFLGGEQDDEGADIAVDPAGNAWIVGWTFSPDFPVTGSGFTPGNIHGDIFVTKLDPEGGLIWSTRVGGSGDDLGFAVAVDAAGHAYVAGGTGSYDFPRVRSLQGPSALFDAVIFKLSPSGDALLYSTYLGGSDEDQGEGIAVDPRGSAYVVGRTYSPDLPVTNAFQPVYAGGRDMYVAKLAPSGDSLEYLSYLGGSEFESRGGVAVDPQGNAYVAGETRSLDFPVLNAIQPEMNGIGDGFLTQIAPDGSRLVFSTYFGGSGVDPFEGLALGPAGDIYVTGGTTSADYPTVNAPQPSFRGGDFDAMATRFAPGGQDVVWSTYLGGSSLDIGLGIAVDARGSAHVTGYTFSADFPLKNPVRPDCSREANGLCASQVFLTQIAPAGSELVHSTYLGDGFGTSVGVDARGAAYVTGTANPGFPTTFNAFQPEFGGGRVDAFVAKVAVPLANRPPECGAAFANPSLLWPPNGKLATISVRGVTDPEGEPVRIAITGIRQDERPRSGAPDAFGLGSPTARVRAERAGGGDGRVYRLTFQATDPAGATCTGQVTVCVPHDRRPGAACGDGGALFDSTGPGR